MPSKGLRYRQTEPRGLMLAHELVIMKIAKDTMGAAGPTEFLESIERHADGLLGGRTPPDMRLGFDEAIKMLREGLEDPDVPFFPPDVPDAWVWTRLSEATALSDAQASVLCLP